MSSTDCSPATTTSAAEYRPIRIPLLLWAELVWSLRQRGQGRRESGAFLLANSSIAATRKVCHVAYYDDLDPSALDQGWIEFHSRGYSALWKLCEQQNLRVVADIHTHPGRSVGQSDIDRAHPMVPVAGHVAIILPWFGRCSPISMREAGQYTFRGFGRWDAIPNGRPDGPIKLSLW